MKSLLLAVIFLFAAYPAAGQPPPKAPIDAIFADFHKDNSPGCSIAVTRSGEIVFAAGYGMASLEHRAPFTADSPLHAASVSKQFTSAAIHLLAIAGKLGIDDPVKKHLPELAWLPETVTIRHLLHHTSGLRDQYELLRESGWRIYEDPIRQSDVMRILARQRSLNFEPGSEHLYSNSGYTVAAEIVAKVSGQTFREFTLAQLFKPLGMTRTFFRDNYREVVPGQALGYSRDARGWFLDMPQLSNVGPSSLVTTTNDLAKWLIAWERKQAPLTAAIQEQMLERIQVTSAQVVNYARGVVHGRYRGSPAIVHSGTDAAYATYLMYVPGSQLGIACLCNTQTDAGRLAYRVADAVTGIDAVPAANPPREAVKLSREELARYEAVFALPGGYRARRIFVDAEGRLRMDALTNLHLLQPLGEHRFRNPARSADLEIIMDANGRASKLIESEDGMRFQYDAVAAWKPGAVELQALAGCYWSDELGTGYQVEVREGGLALVNRTGITPLFPVSNLLFQSQRSVVHFVTGSRTAFERSTGRMRNLRYERIDPTEKACNQ